MSDAGKEADAAALMGRREFSSGAAASAQATCAPPPDFPSDISLYQRAYQNWSREIRISSLWTCAYDIWGWSKNLLLYIKPTTLRITANGYAVLMSRSNVQRALNKFANLYKACV